MELYASTRTSLIHNGNGSCDLLLADMWIRNGAAHVSWVNAAVLTLGQIASAFTGSAVQDHLPFIFPIILPQIQEPRYSRSQYRFHRARVHETERDGSCSPTDPRILR
jgi:hypothetical protein